MVRLSAPPRTVLAALPRRQDRFRLRDRTDGVVAVRHLMHPHGRARKLAELFEAFDCATLASLGRPGPLLAASPRATGVPLASAAENFAVRRALSAQFPGGILSGGAGKADCRFAGASKSVTSKVTGEESVERAQHHGHEASRHESTGNQAGAFSGLRRRVHVLCPGHSQTGYARAEIHARPFRYRDAESGCGAGNL